MQKFKENEYGFGSIEILLLILVVAVIGFGGYYVYSHNKSSNSSSTTPAAAKTSTTTSPSTSTTPAPTKAADPTADWTAYSSAEGRFSLKYPKAWVAATHPDLCSKGILLVAPNADSVGTCGSESDGEIAFIGATDSSHLCYTMDPTAFSGITKSTVTVSGITLTKQSGTTIDDTSGNGTLPKGTLEVNYCYGGSGWGFEALYDHKPTDTDALDDFNTVVTKTLQFTK